MAMRQVAENAEAMNMGIGGSVRRRLGRHERAIAAAYRRFFIDLDALADELGRQLAQPARVLEIGCGEGQMTERLTRIFPDARILGIDLIGAPGRLYSGTKERVVFASRSLESVVAEAEVFDIVVLADVLHHVPMEQRAQFLTLAWRTVAAGGVLMFKDWERNATLGYWLGYAADRFITGDRVVYHSSAELHDWCKRSFAEGRVIAEWRIAPWSSNVCILIRRPNS